MEKLANIFIFVPCSFELKLKIKLFTTPSKKGQVRAEDKFPARNQRED